MYDDCIWIGYTALKCLLIRIMLKLDEIQNGQRISLKDFKSLPKNLQNLSRKGAANRRLDDSSIVDDGDKQKIVPKKEPSKSKLNNKKVVIDGITFDSGWEGERYCILKVLQRQGEISNLKLQVPFDLSVNGHHVTQYRADFVYEKDGEEIVEDAKGYVTPEYRIKRELMKAVHDITIFETYKQKRATKKPISRRRPRKV